AAQCSPNSAGASGAAAAAAASSQTRRLEEAMGRIMALALERRHRQPLCLLGADLGIGKVASRILCPWIAGNLKRTDARVAATDSLERAGAATALQRAWPLAKQREHRVGAGPQRRERRVADRADRVVRPIGVRMHAALGVDVGDADTRGVAAPGLEMGT